MFIPVGVTVDDTWLGPALCAYAYANPSWMASRAPCNADGDSGMSVTLYDPAYDDEVAVYVPYEVAQAEILMGDVDGFAWWPAGWRMAAATLGEVTGSVDQDDTVNGNMTIGLEIVGGKGATLQAVGGSGLDQSALLLQTSTTAATLMGDTYYVVMNYTSAADTVYLDGLNGQGQYFTYSQVFADVDWVAQGQIPS
ncbi:hypothetical protein Q5752_007108 [Cryptotrichosporon argae]